MRGGTTCPRQHLHWYFVPVFNKAQVSFLCWAQLGRRLVRTLPGVFRVSLTPNQGGAGEARRGHGHQRCWPVLRVTNVKEGRKGGPGRPRKERVRSPRLGEQTGSGLRRSGEGNAWREKTREAFHGWNDSGAVRGLSRLPRGGNRDRRARMGRRVRESRAEAEPQEPVWVGSQVALGSWD